MLGLILIIYLAFISLGLPDSLLGSAWPTMHVALDVPLSYMGIVSIIVILSTIVSSLFSERIINRFGTGLVTALSVLMSAVGLFGYSITNSLAVLCLWAIPYGLGAGAVDAALNHYVAVHLKAKHMSWLHCFWGIGAISGPYIMGCCLSHNGRWQGGYRVVSIIQFSLAVVLFFSLPLWHGPSTEAPWERKSQNRGGIRNAWKRKGVTLFLLTFIGYSALEATTGVWASSYLCKYKGLAEDISAKYAALFFLGITVGRLLSGFVSEKLGTEKLLRTGFICITIGVICIWIPSAEPMLTLAGLVITGLGCAPIYPSLIHSVPQYFGTEHSQAIIGLQMAFSCAAAAIMPPLFGVIATIAGLRIYPVYLMIFLVLTITGLELLFHSVLGEESNAAFQTGFYEEKDFQ